MDELEKYRELEVEYERNGFTHVPKCILLLKYYLCNRYLNDALRFAIKLNSSKVIKDIDAGGDKLQVLIRYIFKLHHEETITTND